MSPGFSERGRLVPSSVLGCRRWNVERDGSLHSYSAGYQWEPGWQRAMCRWGFGNHLDIDAGRYCGCGFWAYWDEHGEHVKIEPGRSAVAGIIEGRGPAVVGGSGFRISEARIVALIYPPQRRSQWALIGYCVVWAVYFLFMAGMTWFGHNTPGMPIFYGAFGGIMLGFGLVALFKLPLSQKKRIASRYPEVKFYGSWKAAYKDYPIEIPSWRTKR